MPGTEIVTRDFPPPRSSPTDTGVWFVAGLTQRGPTNVAGIVGNLEEFIRRYGKRQTYSVLYDAVEAYFREGGARLRLSRVVGTAAAIAGLTLNDAAAAAALRVNAKDAGEWGNNLRVQVIAGTRAGNFVLVISHLTDGELERSPDLGSKVAALAWAASSEHVTLVDQASSNNPAVIGPTPLSGGNDDRASITDVHWQTALALFVRDLGPGQVSFPGRTTTQAHVDLLAHGAANNRVAVLDAPDTSSSSTLRASAQNIRAAAGIGNTVRYGGMFAPWAVIPGITPGTTRTVPYSAIQAGLIARSDGSGQSPNVAAAGENGEARYAIGLTQPPFVDKEDLNNNGVNLARDLYGRVRTYGYRTLADPLVQKAWRELSSVRLFMVIASKADVIIEKYVFSQIDGKRKRIGAMGGELTGMVLRYYDLGSLYGESPEEAFNVDVGNQVNTPETISNGELRAVLALKTSPFAEKVRLELVKTAITEAVA